MHSFTKEVHHIEDLTQIFYRSDDEEFVIRLNLADDCSWWIKMYLTKPIDDSMLVLNLNSDRATMLSDVLLDIQREVATKQKERQRVGI